MTPHAPEKSPLARLVLVIVCLAAAGAFLAGAHYYTIDLPHQIVLSGHPPANANSDTSEKCNSCLFPCSYLPTTEEVWKCRANCELMCGDG